MAKLSVRAGRIGLPYPGSPQSLFWVLCLPASKPQWTMGVFARTHWVDLCLVDAIVEPTHFLPLPPEVM